MVFTSPAIRARKTADRFAKEFGIEGDRFIIDHEIYESHSSLLKLKFMNFPNAWDSIMIFGHNPGFTAIANNFGGAYIANLPTCGVAVIESGVNSWSKFDDTTASRTALYFPKEVKDSE